MSNGFIDLKSIVKIFLQDLNTILDDKSLKFILLPRNDKKKEFTTSYCLRNLNLDYNDVINILKKLTEKNYIETCYDKRDIYSSSYYVFGINIQNKEVYIKLKIQDYENKIVLCMSFHFTEFKFKKFPYRLGD